MQVHNNQGHNVTKIGEKTFVLTPLFRDCAYFFAKLNKKLIACKLLVESFAANNRFFFFLLQMRIVN